MKMETKKVGRPRKVAEAAAVAAESVDAILANKKTDVQLQSEPERTGEKDLKIDYAAASGIQKDFLPGTSILRQDPTYVPEYIEVGGERRRVYNPSEYAVLWAATENVHHWKLCHFRFFPYAPIFSGSGLYEATPDNHVLNGDVRLMFAPIRAWHAYREEIERENALLEDSAAKAFHNKGYRSGIRTFTEDEAGKQSYN